jgi:hypothetical protein
MRRLLFVALAATMATTLAGCGDSSTGPNGTISAQFDLRSINGVSMPYTFSGGTTVVSDVLTLSNDGSYSDVAQLGDGQVSAEQGFYTNNNGFVRFTPDNSNGSYTGSITGSTLTETFSDGTIEVFERR